MLKTVNNINKLTTVCQHTVQMGVHCSSHSSSIIYKDTWQDFIGVMYRTYL